MQPSATRAPMNFLWAATRAAAAREEQQQPCSARLVSSQAAAMPAGGCWPPRPPAGQRRQQRPHGSGAGRLARQRGVGIAHHHPSDEGHHQPGCWRWCRPAVTPGRAAGLSAATAAHWPPPPPAPGWRHCVPRARHQRRLASRPAQHPPTTPALARRARRGQCSEFCGQGRHVRVSGDDGGSPHCAFASTICKIHCCSPFDRLIRTVLSWPASTTTTCTTSGRGQGGQPHAGGGAVACVAGRHSRPDPAARRAARPGPVRAAGPGPAAHRVRPPGAELCRIHLCLRCRTGGPAARRRRESSPWCVWARWPRCHATSRRTSCARCWAGTMWCWCCSRAACPSCWPGCGCTRWTWCSPPAGAQHGRGRLALPAHCPPAGEPGGAAPAAPRPFRLPRRPGRMHRCCCPGRAATCVPASS